MMNIPDDLDYFSNLFKVLSDPNRLKLYSILLEGVHCNCELSKLSGLPNNLISHHLHVLSEAGLVNSTRSDGDARWIYYSVNQAQLLKIRNKLNLFLVANDTQDRNPDCSSCGK